MWSPPVYRAGVYGYSSPPIYRNYAQQQQHSPVRYDEPLDWSKVKHLDPNILSKQSDLTILKPFINEFVNSNFDLVNSQVLNPLSLRLCEILQIALKYMSKVQVELKNTIQKKDKEIKKNKEKLIKLASECQRLESLLQQKNQSYDRCPICRLKFINAEYLDKHFAKHHPIYNDSWLEIRSLKKQEIPSPSQAELQSFIIKEEKARIQKQSELFQNSIICKSEDITLLLQGIEELKESFQNERAEMAERELKRDKEVSKLQRELQETRMQLQSCIDTELDLSNDSVKNSPKPTIRKRIIPPEIKDSGSGYSVPPLKLTEISSSSTSYKSKSKSKSYQSKSNSKMESLCSMKYEEKDDSKTIKGEKKRRRRKKHRKESSFASGSPNKSDKLKEIDSEIEWSLEDTSPRKFKKGLKTSPHLAETKPKAIKATKNISISSSDNKSESDSGFRIEPKDIPKPEISKEENYSLDGEESFSDSDNTDIKEKPNGKEEISSYSEVESDPEEYNGISNIQIRKEYSTSSSESENGGEETPKPKLSPQRKEAVARAHELVESPRSREPAPSEVEEAKSGIKAELSQAMDTFRGVPASVVRHTLRAEVKGSFAEYDAINSRLKEELREEIPSARVEEDEKEFEEEEEEETEKPDFSAFFVDSSESDTMIKVRTANNKKQVPRSPSFVDSLSASVPSSKKDAEEDFEEEEEEYLNSVGSSERKESKLTVTLEEVNTDSDISKKSQDLQNSNSDDSNSNDLQPYRKGQYLYEYSSDISYKEEKISNDINNNQQLSDYSSNSTNHPNTNKIILEDIEDNSNPSNEYEYYEEDHPEPPRLSRAYNSNEFFSNDEWNI